MLQTFSFRKSRATLLVALFGALIIPPSDAGGQQTTGPLRHAYTEYHNERYSFSFEYPRDWNTNEALDGGAVTIAPAGAPHRSKISVSGEVVQADETGRARTMEEDFESHLASIKKARPHASYRISNVVLQKKEATTFRGFRAIASTVTYDIDDQSWINEGIMFHTQDDHYTFSIQIQCHADEIPIFQAAYDEILETFRRLGPPK